MGRRSNEFKEALENLRKIKNNIHKIANDASEYICDYLEYDYKNIIDEMIKDYYYDYSPIYYRRQYSLYQAYKIYNTSKAIDIDFDAQYMEAEHRINNEYIYKWMFEEGYHGGARHKMTRDGETTYMQWRTPHPLAVASGNAVGPPYRRWSKRTVYRSASPYDRINMALDKYDKTKKNERIRQGLELAFDKYGIII